MIVNPTLYSVLERTNAEKSRFLINQWRKAFGDLGDIWTVIEYLRLFCERFHLDEGSVLFAASFSPKTPSILPAAPISNVRPPGIRSCRAESGAAGAVPRRQQPWPRCHRVKIEGVWAAGLPWLWYLVLHALLCKYIFLKYILDRCVCVCAHVPANISRHT